MQHNKGNRVLSSSCRQCCLNSSLWGFSCPVSPRSDVFEGYRIHMTGLDIEMKSKSQHLSSNDIRIIYMICNMYIYNIYIYLCVCIVVFWNASYIHNEILLSSVEKNDITKDQSIDAGIKDQHDVYRHYRSITCRLPPNVLSATPYHACNLLMSTLIFRFKVDHVPDAHARPDLIGPGAFAKFPSKSGCKASGKIWRDSPNSKYGPASIGYLGLRALPNPGAGAQFNLYVSILDSDGGVAKQYTYSVFLKFLDLVGSKQCQDQK